ncbi:hypothetical protein EIP91_009778 [Steccherinum ochraceum]|uniref:Uncharacterized protein n=1 Tax=Steccherinum ochraceum TaxID=92696 RepID=A0A4R0R188_9APHY|nr:hypothetical protein EIP91_009778 [Steccherinum ochraceum]
MAMSYKFNPTNIEHHWYIFGAEFLLHLIERAMCKNLFLYPQPKLNLFRNPAEPDGTMVHKPTLERVSDLGLWWVPIQHDGRAIVNCARPLVLEESKRRPSRKHDYASLYASRDGSGADVLRVKVESELGKAQDGAMLQANIALRRYGLTHILLIVHTGQFWSYRLVGKKTKEVLINEDALEELLEMERLQSDADDADPLGLGEEYIQTSPDEQDFIVVLDDQEWTIRAQPYQADEGESPVEGIEGICRTRQGLVDVWERTKGHWSGILEVGTPESWQRSYLIQSFLKASIEHEAAQQREVQDGSMWKWKPTLSSADVLRSRRANASPWIQLPIATAPN